LRDMKCDEPDTEFVLTTNTASGKTVLSREVGKHIHMLYVPLDSRFTVKRFMKYIQPKLAVIFETELWPNIFNELHKRDIPIIIANARISDKAFLQYKRIRFLLKPLLQKITLCLAQSDQMRKRFIALGMSEDKAIITGNMKYDLVQQALEKTERKEGAVLFLAASTHPGEEKLILEAFKQAQIHNDALKLILVPRHIERSDAIEAEVLAHGFKCKRISHYPEAKQYSKNDLPNNETIVLVDIWGALDKFYALADIVFMGGSLVPVGGHNLVEPAALGKMILHGPYMQNFKEMTDLFTAQNASISIANQEELLYQLKELSNQPGSIQSYGDRAKSIVDQERGATKRNIKEISLCLSKQ